MTVSHSPVVVAVSGVKNSGKTALIAAMLPHLTAAGLRVAVIKHDGHRFLPEPLDTDTGRFQPVSEAYLISQFPEAHLILLEGFKYSAWPKLEVVRAGNSAAPVSNPATLLALVTDLPLSLPGVPVLPLGDAAGAAAVVLRYVKGVRGGTGRGKAVWGMEKTGRRAKNRVRGQKKQVMERYKRARPPLSLQSPAPRAAAAAPGSPAALKKNDRKHETTSGPVAPCAGGRHAAGSTEGTQHCKVFRRTLPRPQGRRRGLYEGAQRGAL